MIKLLAIVVVVSSFLAVTNVNAEIKEYKVGWTNLTPCSKVTHDRTSLGFTLPTLRTAPQEYHLYISSDLPADSTVQAAANECAVYALGACSVAAFATAGAACWPAFVAAFENCATSRFTAGLSTAVSTLKARGEAICRW